jgi:hypothetical protein
MTEVIDIISIDSALSFLTAIAKIVPGNTEGAKFQIDNAETQVSILNSNKTIRCYINTPFITCDNPISFCYQNIQTLIKSIQLIKNIEGNEFAKIKFNGNFLTYNQSVSWKLKTVKESIVENWITEPITTTLVPSYSFVTSSDKIKSVVGCMQLVDENVKLYISTNDNDEIIAILDNKESEFSNSVGIPISSSVDGTVESICLFLDNFSMFNLINSNKIIVNYTKQKVVEVLIKEEDLKVRLIMATIKG